MLNLIPPNLNYDFLGKRYFAYGLSICLIALSVYMWVSKGEQKFGIDYLGGHELVVKVATDTSATKIRDILGNDGLQPVVQAFESEKSEYSIRLADDRSSSEVKKILMEIFQKAYPDKVEILKADYVGPTIGEELKWKSLLAIIIGLVGMLTYITFRFELAFAVGAVAALFHDVIVTMGIYLLCDMTVSVATLAAALTIVGYSVNDTIIVFDRIREEILKRRNDDLDKIINESISSTLSRTVITSLLTLFSAVALLMYGGGAIAELSLFLCVGVIAGTYSTIFIASPVALAWESFQSRASSRSQSQAANA